MPLHATWLHEQSVRIVLQAIDAAANRYKRYIVPLVSVSIDFYVRVFVRVFESPAQVRCVSCVARLLIGLDGG